MQLVAGVEPFGESYQQARLDDAEERFDRTLYELKLYKKIDASQVSEIKGIYLDAVGRSSGQSTVYVEGIRSLADAGEIDENTEYDLINAWLMGPSRVFTTQTLDAGPTASNKWLREFNAGDTVDQKRKRAEIYEQSKQATHFGYSDGVQVHRFSPNALNEARAKLRLMTAEDSIQDLEPPYDTVLDSKGREQIQWNTSTRYTVKYQNLLDYIEKTALPDKLMVLIPAHREQAGGAVVLGASGLEEDFYRRTNAHIILHPAYNRSVPEEMMPYRLPEYGGLVLEQGDTIQFFRKHQGMGYRGIPPKNVAFLLAAPYNHLSKQGSVDAPSDDLEYEQGVQEKLRRILRIARLQGAEHLALSDWGCQDFGADPATMIELMMAVFSEEEFLGQFRSITWYVADYDRYNSFRLAIKGLGD
jgi:hypothetical protein